MISAVERLQTQGQGIRSQARRDFKFAEVLSLLTAARIAIAGGSGSELYFFLVVVCMQWHMIARVDDTMKLAYENITHNVQFPFALTFKINASKNISHEGQITEQIMLGSMNPQFCVLLNLAIYIELVLDGTHDGDREYIFGSGGKNEASKRKFSKILKDLLKHPSFHRLAAGLLGTHSLRKGPATYAALVGLSREYIARRGRWSGKKQTVDIYIAHNLPYPAW